MGERRPPSVALRGASTDLAERIRSAAAGIEGHDLPCPPDVAGMAWWYATNPTLIHLSRAFDTEITLHVVANCVQDLASVGPPGAAVAVIERVFVEAHAASDEGAIGRATWCGWLLAGLNSL